MQISTIPRRLLPLLVAVCSSNSVNPRRDDTLVATRSTTARSYFHAEDPLRDLSNRADTWRGKWLRTPISRNEADSIDHLKRRALVPVCVPSPF